jgi:hypothetical protein
MQSSTLLKQVTRTGSTRTFVSLFLTFVGVAQNDFLKGYISRLQKALQDATGSFPGPPDPATITESDSLPVWGADPSLLSPLFIAYDKRIEEADQINDRMRVELSSINMRVKQLSLENERLVSEVKELTELAISKMEMQDNIGQPKS